GNPHSIPTTRGGCPSRSSSITPSTIPSGVWSFFATSSLSSTSRTRPSSRMADFDFDDDGISGSSEDLKRDRDRRQYEREDHAREHHRVADPTIAVIFDEVLI